MRRLRANRATVLVVVAALVVAAGAAAVGWVRRDRAGPVSRLVVATGGVGGVYHEYGEGLAAAARAAFPAADVRILTTAASVENLRLVADGAADLGFALADSAALAVAGQPPFRGPQPVAAVARLYENYTHLVVRADSDIRRVADLRDRAVSTGAADSGTELIAGRLLQLAGLDPATGVRRRQLSVQDSARALRAGTIAAFFFSGGLPTRAIAELARDTPIRLVGLAGFVPALRGRYGELYTERSIPASTYGLAAEVATVGVPNLLVVNAALPEAAGYAVTRLLFDAKSSLVAVHPEAKRLNRRAATATHPVPLHPGAARYYREVKP